MDVKHEIKSAEEDRPRVVKWWLEVDAEGEVDLRCEDVNGEDWYVITIKRDGSFIRQTGIAAGGGLDVNSRGQIKESGY